MAYQDYDNTLKAEWNMDDAMLKHILLLKHNFVQSIHTWDLNSAYFTLREVWMEVEAKFKPKERGRLRKMIKELEIVRNEYFKDQRHLKGKFFSSLQNGMIKLNRLMKKHGLYFREHDDSGL